MNRDQSVTASSPLQINVPLLRKTLEFAEAHPEEIDLRFWARRTSCGTVACLAGTAVTLAGLPIDWNKVTCGHVDYLADGRHICEAAGTELGLTRVQALELFYQKHLSDCWAIAEKFTNGEIQRPMK